FLDAIEEAERPEQTVERLAGIYGVLKPHLLASYTAHMEGVNEVYEPPTRRILARCVEDERRHIGAGSVVLRHLTTTSALESRARAWRARIESLLAASGGVTGRGLPPVRTGGPDPASVPLSDDGKEFIDLERAGARHAIPEDLESAIRRLGEALI